MHSVIRVNAEEKDKIRISYREDTLMHSVIRVNAEEKDILPGINFAGPLGNIPQLLACCRYKNPALTRCTNSTILFLQGHT
jgi:hypothetical protein